MSVQNTASASCHPLWLGGYRGGESHFLPTAPSLADSGKPTHFLKDIETKGPRGQWAAQLLDIHVMTGAVVSLPVAGRVADSHQPFHSQWLAICPIAIGHLTYRGWPFN